MTISLFDQLLPWVSLVFSVAVVFWAIQGTMKHQFRAFGSDIARSAQPLSYWFLFALYWFSAALSLIVTLSFFDLDVRFWL